MPNEPQAISSPNEFMFFNVNFSDNDILKRIAHLDQTIFDDNLDLKLVEEDLHTPLAVACETGSLDYVNQLLAIDEIRDTAAENEGRALYVAAAMGHVGVVHRLTEIRVVQEALNDTNFSLRFMKYPIEKGHWDVVELLLGFLTPKVTQRLVSVIVEGGAGYYDVNVDHAHIIKLLEYHSFKQAVETSFADKDKHLVMTLADQGAWSLLQAFLDQVSNIDGAGYDDNCALRKAIEAQNVDIVNKLLNLQDVLDVIEADDDNWVFLEAVATGNKELITRLLEINVIKDRALSDMEEVQMEARGASGGSILDWINEQLSVSSTGLRP
jgi:ankyrin repeat protein